MPTGCLSEPDQRELSSYIRLVTLYQTLVKLGTYKARNIAGRVSGSEY